MHSVALLTTDTHHHRYFAREISSRVRSLEIIIETSRVLPGFEVDHPYEADRDEYEREILLGGDRVKFDDLGATLSVGRANDALAVARLRSYAPDIIVAFGTRFLKKDVINIARVACVNLHGGDPTAYRGLDSHLWAIYHKDFGALVAALHHVDLELDTGDLVEQNAVPLKHGMELHELRSENTRVCVELVSRMLARDDSSIPRHPQRGKGRYYSFMPTCLKELCVNRFREYARSL